jgi:hypothetical protein
MPRPSPHAGRPAPAVRALAVALLVTAALPHVARAMPTDVGPRRVIGDEGRAPSSYEVRPGDTLGAIALEVGVPSETLARVNDIDDPARLTVGDVLLVPGSDGRVPTPVPTPTRRPPVERLTDESRAAGPDSPFHRTTWVTFYGRPNVPIMGILGEYDLDDLVPRLERQAAAYDRANGPALDVRPAFHLIYGMASKSPGDDGDNLAYLPESVVERYLERARAEGFGLILDVQIGALEPAEALEPALPFLRHPEVHLALDPEFALSDGQEIPGRPPGFVTGAQINAAQRLVAEAMADQGVDGHKMLVVHQFMPEMIEDKADIRPVPGVDLVLDMDGFGPTWTKIWHYNRDVSPGAAFTGFKLFYRWDDPLLTEAEVMGLRRPEMTRFIEITPNLVIYQ